MITQKESRIEHYEKETPAEAQHEAWAHCHVNWTAVWTGALAMFAIMLLFGLIGVALGAHVMGPEQRIVDVRKMGLWTLVFSVCAAFFSAVAGGWIAARMAGVLHSEPGIIHGATSWLVTIPMLVASAAIGAASLFGGWYGAFGPSAYSTPIPFARPDAVAPNAVPAEIATYKAQLEEYNQKVQKWQEETPKVVRNNALIAVTALLLGLLGAVIGGWMASGEPMNFSHYRTRKPLYRPL